MSMSDVAVAKEIYERLETYRQSAGISQEKLVDDLGISRPTYARIKKGTCSLSTFISVLRAFNLLEGLNLLVPPPTVRPSEIATKQLIRNNMDKVLHSTSSEKPPTVRLDQIKYYLPFTKSINTKKMSVAEMLVNRNKQRSGK